MKRTMISALAAVLLVACGDSSDEITGPSSTTATLYFTLDEATCGAGNSGVLTLYVDGASVGTLTAQGGSKTPNYTVNGGTTIYVSAKWALSTGEVTWPRDNLKIPVGGTYNQILPCA
jgi:hypothetical protein